MWETAHSGVESAARKTGVSIYWNAPTREDDFEAQVALVDHVLDSHQYQGLVLAPDQAYALISPVQRAISRGIPTAIISSPISIPAGGDLFYVLNNDEEGGRLAAQRVIALLHGQGTVAELGIDPDIDGILVRARAFEQYLTQNGPGIKIIVRRIGSFNFPHERQVAEETLRSNPNLDVIVGLMWTSTSGTLDAINSMPTRRSVQVIGFDAAVRPAFDSNPNLDSIVQENTLSMGKQAIELIDAKLKGLAVPTLTRVDPKLITRENIRLMCSRCCRKTGSSGTGAGVRSNETTGDPRKDRDRISAIYPAVSWYCRAGRVLARRAQGTSVP